MIHDVPIPISTRSETANETPKFRKASAKHRFLALLDGFNEWMGERGNKRPFRDGRTDREPYPYTGL